MSKHDNVLTYYKKLLNDSTIDFERVGWGSLQSQEKRFLVLSEIGVQSGHSVLDVGCGLGNLYDWFLSHEIVVDYSGVDINKKMIEELNQSKPDINFQWLDLLESTPEHKSFDFVLMSGALTIPVDNQESVVEKTLNIMYDLCRVGVAVNFMSISADVIKPGMYYASPTNICGLVESITRRYVLRHDYMTHDFTVYMYR